MSDGRKDRIDRGVPARSIYAELDRILCKTEQVAWRRSSTHHGRSDLEPLNGDVVGLLQGNDRGHK